MYPEQPTNCATVLTTKLVILTIFMARRAIPMIVFPRVRCMFIYIYIYILVSLARLCVVYVVKEVASFPGPRSINGRGA